MKRLFSYAYLTFKILYYGYKSAWIYRKSFIIQSAAMFINDIMLLAIWIMFFSRFEDVNGWTFENTQLLFVTHLGAFVFAIMIFGGVLKISERIGEGNLDQFLVQPRSVLWRCLSDGFSLSILGDLGFLIAMLIFVCVTQGWGYLLIVPLVSALAGWGVVMINVAFQSIGFWVKRFERAAWHYFWTVEAPGFYPQTAIIGGLKVFLLTAVPSVWIITFPYNFVQDREYIYLGLLLGFNIFMTIVATTMFRAGLKRYESGSLVRVNT